MGDPVLEKQAEVRALHDKALQARLEVGQGWCPERWGHRLRTGPYRRPSHRAHDAPERHPSLEHREPSRYGTSPQYPHA